MLDYLICIDFEATCDENYEDASQTLVKKGKSEIIELPLLVIENQTQKVIFQKQFYLKPKETQITPYCTQLTGITQEIVDQAKYDLENAIKWVDEWIHNEILSKEKSFCFVTHGLFDICGMLFQETKRKNIQLKDYWWRFMDITKEVLKYENEKNPLLLYERYSLGQLTRMLDLKIHSTLHTGIGDAEVIQDVIKCLHEKAPGKYFTEPYDLQKERKLFIQQQDHWVRLQGVPHQIQKDNFSIFMKELGLEVDASQIYLLFVKKIHFVGSLFIQFANHKEALKALDSLNGSVFLERVMLGFPASQSEFEKIPSKHVKPLDQLHAHLNVMAVPFTPMTPSSPNGDQFPAPLWQCQVCKNRNKDRMMGCGRCRAQRPNYDHKAMEEKNDWFCQTCKGFNLNFRIYCLFCAQKNPSPQPPFKKIPKKFMTPGDWICDNPICKARNYPQKVYCFRCDAPKPGSEDD